MDMIMFKYDYTSPSPEQLYVRRQQLDDAGFQAWLSPAILLLTLYATRKLLPSSSHVAGSSERRAPSFLLANWRRLYWLFTQPLNPTIGPPYLILSAICYLFYLFYIAARNTTNDYLHLTKSLGHVAVSQLPWHYLLAIKSPLSPVTLATGLTHERLNAWHRSLGRVIATLAISHATLYLKFFVDIGVLQKRLGDWDARLGLMALTTVTGLMIGSLAVVRTKAYYRGFYLGHVLLSALLVIVLWLHMSWTRRYVLQAGIIWVFNAWLRTIAAKPVEVQVEELGGSNKNSSLVRLKLREHSSTGQVLDGWTPGQHVYVRLNNGPLGVVGRKNPFTVADVSADGKELTLVARRLNGTTAVLRNLHGKSIYLEGPYGEAAEYLPRLLEDTGSTAQTLLVAGGIGATYTIPMYLRLLDARGGTQRLKMIWIVRSVRDTEWAEELLKAPDKDIDIDIYAKDDAGAPYGSKISEVQGLEIHSTHGQRPDVTRLLEPIMVDTNANGARQSTQQRTIGRNTGPSRQENLTVMLCGPPSLSKAVRDAVGTHVLSHGREVEWYEEQFGFGGS